MIFVFGSNSAGIHGAGAAKEAMFNHGALFGMGYGHVGNSFAIPTKDRHIETLPILTIKRYVDGFRNYARCRDDLEFKVTRIGCGLAGLHDADIAPLFHWAPKNCLFDTLWAPYLPDTVEFWGSF